MGSVLVSLCVDGRLTTIKLSAVRIGFLEGIISSAVGVAALTDCVPGVITRSSGDRTVLLLRVNRLISAISPFSLVSTMVFAVFALVDIFVAT